MLTHGNDPLPLYVAAHPGTVWLIGPLFAAVTGVAVKEGLCYGKAEAAMLALLLPTLLLGHLSGLMSSGVEQAVAIATTGVALVFAGRKFSQPVKDDIGDKSIFE